MASPGATTVWSPWLRLLHWLLAASTIASFATHEGGGRWHEWLGYTALAAAALRTMLGFALGGYAAFGQFVRGFGATWVYARTVWQRAEPRYLGHNPLGGWMVVAILANSLATGLTGWLYTTERFWGTAWLEELHGALGHAFIPLVLLHVAGVAFTSWRHRENLVAAMLHGRKRPVEPGDAA
jgi:cytochrome b